MPTKQPILDEIHKVREQMLADAGGTLAGLIAKMQAEQAKSGRKIWKAGNTTEQKLCEDKEIDTIE